MLVPVQAALDYGHVTGMSPSHSDHFVIFIRLLTSGATPPRPVLDNCMPQDEELFVGNRQLADMVQHTKYRCAQFMESSVIRLRGPLRLPCTCYVMLLRVEWEPLQFVLPEVVIKRLVALSPQLPKPHTSFRLQMAVFRVMTTCRLVGFRGTQCLHCRLQVTSIGMEVVPCTKTGVSTYKSTLCHKPEDRHQNVLSRFLSLASSIH